MRTLMTSIAAGFAVALCAADSPAQSRPVTAATTVARTPRMVGTAAPCSYLDCALRVEPGMRGARLIRGADGRLVGRLGLFHKSGIDSLLAMPDSTGLFARRYVAERHSGLILQVIGMALLAGSAIRTTTRHHWDGWDFATQGVGYGFLIPASRRLTRADQNLSRAVWWYNSSLPR
jgi:hypothetical protein